MSFEISYVDEVYVPIYRQSSFFLLAVHLVCVVSTLRD